MSSPTFAEPDATYVELCGGLGNQLFQAAAGMALAARTGNKLLFDLHCFERDPIRTFELDGLGHGAELCLIRDIKREWPGVFFVEAGFPYDERVESLHGNMFLRGYYQSPHYFASAVDEVRAAFDLRPKVRPEILEQGAELARNGSVSVHVRRGDYVAEPKVTAKHGILGRPYYRKAVTLIRRIAAQASLLVFSDQPDEAVPLFDDIEQVSFASGNSHFEDMYLMQCCRHHIIANSSFSWWGAWLGQHEATVTIAPRNWFTRETMMRDYCGDLFPEGWILL